MIAFPKGRLIATVTALGWLLCLSTAYAQGPDRSVSWVPGLGEGDDDVWATYDELFAQEREMAGIRHGSGGAGTNGLASTQAPIGQQSDALARDIDNNAPARSIGRVLGIGHSNGGLVLRSQDANRLNGTRRYNAIVTVGTPNHGAAISNSIISGELTRELDRGCRALLAGPKALIRFANPFTDVSVQGFSSRYLCGTAREFVIEPELDDQVASAASRDAAVGSSFLEALRNTGQRVPIVSINGNEQRPVHWRLLSSRATGNEDDQLFQHVANIMRGVYAGTAVFFAVKSVVRAFSFNPVSWAMAAVSAYQSVQWVRGERWLANSEQYWLDALDCHERVIRRFVEVDRIDMTCLAFNTASAEWLQCMERVCPNGLGGVAGCIVTNKKIAATTTINTSSDGFVCQGTQLFGPFNEANNYEAEGVNHSDETNTTSGQTLNGNDEMADVFREVFDRSDEFGLQERP